jgi:hypothetical protein
MNDFKLDKEPKISSGFTMPEGYFDAFSEKVLAQLPKQEPKVISIFSSRRIWQYASAAVLTLMISIPLYNRYSVYQEEIDSAVLENYLAYNATISEDEIVNLLSQEDLDKMKMELNLDDQAIEEALKSNPNLEEYIID